MVYFQSTSRKNRIGLRRIITRCAHYRLCSTRLFIEKAKSDGEVFYNGVQLNLGLSFMNRLLLSLFLNRPLKFYFGKRGVIIILVLAYNTVSIYSILAPFESIFEAGVRGCENRSCRCEFER